MVDDKNLELPTEFEPMEDGESSYPEALKYEILGLRQEMNQYMHHQFLVENFSLTAAAVSFTYMLSINSGAEQFESASNLTNVIGETVQSRVISSVYYTTEDLVKTAFLSLVTLVILHFGLNRLRMLRYRISRLGLYIYLREKLYPTRCGWEHFVHTFRELNFDGVTEKYILATKLPNSKERAEALNSLVSQIDKSPGSFTANIYLRWRFIIFLAYMACAAQLTYVSVQLAYTDAAALTEAAQVTEFTPPPFSERIEE